jgi:hypothetical protein
VRIALSPFSDDLDVPKKASRIRRTTLTPKQKSLPSHGGLFLLSLRASGSNSLQCSDLFHIQINPLECGGDDGARTRDLCRDSTEASSNLLKLRVTDGFFWRSEIPLVTVIGPLSDPRPLPCKPLPTRCVGESRQSAYIGTGEGDGSRHGHLPTISCSTSRFLQKIFDFGVQFAGHLQGIRTVIGS